MTEGIGLCYCAYISKVSQFLLLDLYSQIGRILSPSFVRVAVASNSHKQKEGKHLEKLKTCHLFAVVISKEQAESIGFSTTLR